MCGYPTADGRFVLYRHNYTSFQRYLSIAISDSTTPTPDYAKSSSKIIHLQTHLLVTPHLLRVLLPTVPVPPSRLPQGLRKGLIESIPRNNSLSHVRGAKKDLVHTFVPTLLDQ